MRRTIRAAALIAILVLVLLGTGCGDDERVKADNAYVEQTNQAVRSFEARFQQLQTRFTPVSTPVQDRQTLAVLRAAVDRAVAQLGRIKAPARIAPLHARLVAEAQQYDAVITDAVKAFSAEDLKQVGAARSRLSTDLAAVATKVTTTINLINRRLQ